MSLLSGIVGGVLGALKSFFGNGGVGGAVGNGVAHLAVIAALAPAVLWLVANMDQVAVTITWGQLALGGLIAVFILKIIHYSRPGSPRDRQDIHPQQ